MWTSTSAKRHEAHLFMVGVLFSRSQSRAYPKSVRAEASADLLRVRDQGIIINKYGKEKPVAKKTRAHETKKRTFSGQGIVFAVVDDREGMPPGKVSTIDILTMAIEDALDKGHEDSEAIARYLVTSAFQHEPNKRVRFNSILKAGDAVGALILRKLYNAYNELAVIAEEEQDADKKKVAKAEASGFAAATTIVMSPFSCEYEEDPRLVDWDEVDRITEGFEKEQRLVRKERKGNPQ